MADVQIGDRTVPLPQLNGFKAVRAARLVADVSKCAPDVLERLAKLRAEYAETNALVVTPALAKLPRFNRTVVDADGNEHEEPVFSAEDFEAAGGEIRIPQDPSGAEQVIAVFPVVFDAAERQVVELLALLTAPNSELADADENGTVDDYLASAGRKLLHAATLDQLVVLATSAIEMVTEALTQDGGAALERAMGAVTGSGSPQATAPSTATAAPTPASQTALDVPTVGDGATPSTTSVGANSGNYSSG